MSQKIIAFKILSGEEIIGRIESDDEDTLTLSKARVIQMVQTGPQTMGMAMVPFMASNVDGEIPFKKSAIITEPVTPSEESEKPYMQQTTSIALA